MWHLWDISRKPIWPFSHLKWHEISKKLHLHDSHIRIWINDTKKQKNWWTLCSIFYVSHVYCDISSKRRSASITDKKEPRRRFIISFFFNLIEKKESRNVEMHFVVKRNRKKVKDKGYYVGNIQKSQLIRN